jgi:L-asparagine oxygenase
MTSVLEVGAAPATVVLSPGTASAVADVVAGLLPAAGAALDDVPWLAEAGRWSHDLPVSLRRAVADFRRDPGVTGVLLLRGLPLDETLLPDTPTVSGSVQREASPAAAVLMLLANLLGDPIAFRAEKSGAMVQDVVPVPGREDVQGNEGSALLTFHKENAFHEHSPDYVLLLCLRADHDRVAGLRSASIRQVYEDLSDDSRQALFRAEFITAPPASFGTLTHQPRPHAVLCGAPDDPDVLVDFESTRPLTPWAVEAMAELQSLFCARALTHYLVPGDLVVVDNRVTVHGRTAFVPRYDGRDRWLQRSFVSCDLRRSRSHRTGDGHVLYG